MTAGVSQVVLSQELPGRVVAVRTAEVRARVPGIVLTRHFQEGSNVKAGQLLYTIDPAPSRAALNRAEAVLAQSEAALSDAQAVVKRYTPLVKIEAVSQQDFDTAQTTLKSAQAARMTALADLETAKLNLAYTTVKAPVAGRIGKSLVTEGALVGQGEATALVTIQQLDRVYVDFSRPAADFVRAREANPSTTAAELTVSVEGSNKVYKGRALFTDATVDPTSGQVSVRGEFPNKDSLLLPGMYVRVNAADGGPSQVILVPQRAVQRGTDAKPLVLVLGADGKVAARPVTTGRMSGANYQILTGLNAGERVIVGGTSVQPGATAVVAKLESPSAASSAVN